MAKKPKAKTENKTNSTESAGSKPEAAKTVTSASTVDADSGNDGESSGESSGDSSGGGKKSSAPSRPISYFSSVSSNDYRAGWDGVFGGGETKPKRKAAKPAASKRNGKLPMTITLDADDLDPSTREQLEALLRQQARKKRLNYDKLSGNGQVSWQVSCRISSA